jgi:hypothetical protein
MAENPVTVATFRFVNEAELAKLHLEEEGIPAFLADAETITMDWFLGIAAGYIKLQVPRSRAEDAAAVLARQAQARPRERPAEAAEAEANPCLACGADLPEDESQCPACGWSYAGEAEG